MARRQNHRKRLTLPPAKGKRRSRNHHSSGDFATNNSLAAGNPHRIASQQMRTAAFAVLTPEKMQEVIEGIIKLATEKKGDKRVQITAAKFLFDRSIGRPAIEERMEPADVVIEGHRKARLAQAAEAVYNIDYSRETGDTPDDTLIVQARSLTELGVPPKHLARGLGVAEDMWAKWIQKGKVDHSEGELESPESLLFRAIEAGLVLHQVDQVLAAREADAGLKILERRDPDNFGRRRLAVEEAQDHADPDDRFE